MQEPSPQRQIHAGAGITSTRYHGVVLTIAQRLFTWCCASRLRPVRCQVIGEPIKQTAELNGEPIKSTGKPALRIALPAPHIASIAAVLAEPIEGRAKRALGSALRLRSVPVPVRATGTAGAPRLGCGDTSRR